MAHPVCTTTIIILTIIIIQAFSRSGTSLSSSVPFAEAVAAAVGE